MMEGKTFKRRGQQYDCVGRFEHEVPARFVWIYELRSHCADCGRGFGLTASSGQIHNRQLNRRCEHCHNPGVPVAEIAAPKAKRKPDRRRKGRKRTARKTVEAPKPATVSAEQAAIVDTYQDALGVLL